MSQSGGGGGGCGDIDKTVAQMQDMPCPEFKAACKTACAKSGGKMVDSEYECSDSVCKDGTYTAKRACGCVCGDGGGGGGIHTDAVAGIVLFSAIMIAVLLYFLFLGDKE